MPGLMSPGQAAPAEMEKETAHETRPNNRVQSERNGTFTCEYLSVWSLANDT